MVEVDTFLTTLYVMVDDFCQCHPPKKRPGPKASLSDSEVVTLAIFARWGRFSQANETSTAMQGAVCEAPFLSCRIARSSTDWCVRG
jgi:hypothetical protein